MARRLSLLAAPSRVCRRARSAPAFRRGTQHNDRRPAPREFAAAYWRLPETPAPFNDYVVVILPAEERNSAKEFYYYYIRAARPDTSGRFETRGLKPGRYVAAAIETLEQGRQFAPEFQRQLRSRSPRAFTLREGEVMTLDLRLTPGL